MRKTVRSLINELLTGLKEAEMEVAAKAMGTSIATAYRYRKSPLDMPLRSFLGLVGHFDLHLDMNVTLHQEDLLEAEKLRLDLEGKISKEKGYRVVTTPHFTVNCEIPEITELKMRDRYDKPFWCKAEELLELRKKRSNIYLNGHYMSSEIVHGDAYIDFFLKRNLFSGLPENLWKKQYELIIETNSMTHINRHIYLRATPELPVMSCYSCGDTVIRLSDLRIVLSKEHLKKSEATLSKFISKSRFTKKNDVRNFLIDPLRMSIS